MTVLRCNGTKTSAFPIIKLADILLKSHGCTCV